MEPRKITLSLEDHSEGFETTPDRVRLADLSRFADDVQALLRGDNKEVDTEKLDVAIRHGSLMIETVPIHAPKLFADLEYMSKFNVLDQRVDVKRRSVIQRWQRQSRAHHDVKFSIKVDLIDFPIVISYASDFRNEDADQWVDVERYVRGVIEDIGGSTKANAHLVLANGEKLTVTADKDLLRVDSVNRLYKQSLLRIKADYNIVTRKLRNARLISFVEHSNKIDQKAFARMQERGAVAWKDVENASDWVDNLRGGSN